jgi:hypothetical protein
LEKKLEKKLIDRLIDFFLIEKVEKFKKRAHLSACRSLPFSCLHRILAAVKTKKV